MLASEVPLPFLAVDEAGSGAVGAALSTGSSGASAFSSTFGGALEVGVAPTPERVIAFRRRRGLAFGGEAICSGSAVIASLAKTGALLWAAVGSDDVSRCGGALEAAGWGPVSSLVG